ncbi:V-type ATP synthase subunit F [Clostridium fallax]|uniref:V/A-type H+-transporting ATPase subunit F n=1 Tax=Clostridium fallax TaxID=1533 RepID=A0A1M4VV58_9CLOT|nr:V-type ATP synthase subunit F [Clostridium fallax]SHE72790.1 V/A-type H+-transporting ATPase subunit F [Clostridium fallax]SQB07708.1 vacuolar H+transporting two-sector ATPase F subunit [Clostridium fallax]
MKSFLISDNKDTLVGMDMAGVDGVILHGEEEIKNKLKELKYNKNIGIIIITEKAASMASDVVKDIKLSKGTPLLVEIPDRHGSKKGENYMLKYVNEAIGLKL